MQHCEYCETIRNETILDLNKKNKFLINIVSTGFILQTLLIFTKLTAIYYLDNNFN